MVEWNGTLTICLAAEFLIKKTNTSFRTSEGMFQFILFQGIGWFSKRCRSPVRMILIEDELESKDWYLNKLIQLSAHGREGVISFCFGALDDFPNDVAFLSEWSLWKKNCNPKTDFCLLFPVPSQVLQQTNPTFRTWKGGCQFILFRGIWQFSKWCRFLSEWS